jgi:uncharacterized pyridoxamine 5'-phosphate oxidase family protein
LPRRPKKNLRRRRTKHGNKKTAVPQKPQRTRHSSTATFTTHNLVTITHHTKKIYRELKEQNTHETTTTTTEVQKKETRQTLRGGYGDRNAIVEQD